ncbi:MAG: family 43 glycosylhydrolase [Kofleriaceae bacterium]|nr:family 43 glycosylhydrolase [Kofleriaceae bacterium]
MRLAPAFIASLFVTACVFAPDSEPDEDDDPAWDVASDPDAPAELDEIDDAADDPVELVDDAPDPAELDEVAEAAEPEVVEDLDVLARAGQYRNPLGPTCADPGIIKIAGTDGPTFWAACTGNGFPLFKSRDLVHWTAAGRIFTVATKPKWAGGNNWAPEIHRVGNGLVAYFTALSPSRGRMCIGAARAASMAGPWRDIGHPLVCDRNVSLIDAHVYSDAAGRHYLYYKTDGNGLSPKKPTIIYGHQLRADGAGFVGKRHALLRNTLGWEGDVVEAPWVIHRGTYYYLFYSGFRYCNATYGVGVARSRSPLGPFTKRSAPILKSNGRWAGPGHNSVVRTGGKAYMVYHAWDAPHACGDPGGRHLMIDAISWKGGWPVVNNGTPSRTARQAPAIP